MRGCRWKEDRETSGSLSRTIGSSVGKARKSSRMLRGGKGEKFSLEALLKERRKGAHVSPFVEMDLVLLNVLMSSRTPSPNPNRRCPCLDRKEGQNSVRRQNEKDDDTTETHLQVESLQAVECCFPGLDLHEDLSDDVLRDEQVVVQFDDVLDGVADGDGALSRDCVDVGSRRLKDLSEDKVSEACSDRTT